jgi:hypothetical protein
MVTTTNTKAGPLFLRELPPMIRTGGYGVPLFFASPAILRVIGPISIVQGARCASHSVFHQIHKTATTAMQIKGNTARALSMRRLAF